MSSEGQMTHKVLMTAKGNCHTAIGVSISMASTGQSAEQKPHAIQTRERASMGYPLVSELSGVKTRSRQPAGQESRQMVQDMHLSRIIWGLGQFFRNRIR